MVRDKQRFAIPARDEDFQEPLKILDPLGWLGGDVRGQRLLCLAAGGGKHGPLYAAAGAEVTVVDISPAMLAVCMRKLCFLKVTKQAARSRLCNRRTCTLFGTVCWAVDIAREKFAGALAN